MNKFCTKCGAPLREGVRFCAVCGAPTPAAAASVPREGVRICPACGKTLEGDLRFCTGCGAPLNQTNPPAASGLKTTMRIPRAPESQETPEARIRPEPVEAPEIPAGQIPGNDAAWQTPESQSPGEPASRQTQARSELRPSQEPPVPPTPGIPAEELPPVPSHDVHSAPTPRAAQMHRQPEAPAPAAPQGQICPGCGNPAEPGRSFCTRCGTRLVEQVMSDPFADIGSPYPDRVSAAPAAQQMSPAAGPSMADAAAARVEAKEQGTRRIGPIIGILVGVLLLIAAAALLLIFRDQIFGGKEDRDRREGSSQGETVPEATTEGTGPAVTDPEDPTVPPETEASVTEEEARTLLEDVYDFPFEAQLVREDADSYLFTLYQVGTDKQLGSVRVDKASGVLTEEKPVSAPELSRVGEVDPDRVADIMDAAVPEAAYSFAVIDLETGEMTGSLSQDEPMSSSVLIGIPVMFAVNQRIASGALSMSDLLPVTATEGSRGSLYGREEMTVRELLQAMLQSSSGDAINTLLNELGMPYVESVCYEAGFTNILVTAPIGKTVDYSDQDNYVSSADLCGILYALYHSDGPINRYFLEENYGIRGSLANDGLGKSLAGVVGSFNGVKREKYNELLLVEHGDHAYAVAMMANGTAYENLLKAYDQVGRYVDSIMEE